MSIDDIEAINIIKQYEPQKIIYANGYPIIVASALFGIKNKKDLEKTDLTSTIRAFFKFLLLTPELEIFTIDSQNGEKEEFPRHRLHTAKTIDYFFSGLIPNSDADNHANGEGKYIFINKEQFERYWNGKPISLSSVQSAPLGTKERESLYKLIIGMAVTGYGYDPKSKKNIAIKEIHNDLALCGIALDEDTIRKWLGKASEILPQ